MDAKKTPKKPTTTSKTKPNKKPMRKTYKEILYNNKIHIIFSCTDQHEVEAK